MRRREKARAEKRAAAEAAEEISAAAPLKAWRYHAEHEPRIFTGDEEIKSAESKGWKDSPAKCDGFLDKIGVDPDNKLQVQYVGDVSEQTAEVINLIENIDTLDREGILKLATLHFVEDWSERRGVEKMRNAMRKLLDADNVIEADNGSQSGSVN